MEVHVTEIVNSLFPYRETAGKVELLERGRLVHRHFFSAIQGLYVPTDPKIEPIVEALTDWWAMADYAFVSSETEVKGMKWGITVVGTLDLIVENLRGPDAVRLEVLDLKVSKALSWQAEVQATLYAWLTEDPVTVVRIDPDTLGIRLHPVHPDADRAIEILDIYRWKERGL